ncbi:response regulator/pilus assembly protein [bacterium]|nr:response regulator/pilus assembly protein [bacterium]
MMKQELSILILDTDEPTASNLKLLLAEIREVGVIVTMTDLSMALKQIKKSDPDVIILSLYPSEDLALKLAEKISHAHPHCMLFVTAPKASPELIIRAMRLGAREFWLQPFRSEEVKNGIHAALRLKNRSGACSVNGKVISVFGVKGGVGATTIAVNLAVAIAQRTLKDVLLLDADFQLGHAGLYLNCKPKFSVLDIINNFNNIDLGLLKSTLAKSSAEVSFLGGPAGIEEADAIKPAHMEQLLSLLRSLFDYIVVDIRPVFDEINIRLLDESDLILVVANFDVPSIYNAKRCIELFRRLGYDRDKVFLVMNRYVAHEVLDLEAVENSIGHPVFWRIPNQEYGAMIRSINEGMPMSRRMPKGRFSVSLAEMLDRFNGNLDAVPAGSAAANKPNRLRKLLSSWSE